MVEGTEYVQSVRNVFSFLSEEYGITDTSEEIGGNVFYDVQYKTPSKVISISYENIEDYLQVIVFKMENGKLPDYDDKKNTLHLSALNKIAFSNVCNADIERNNQYFSHIKAETTFERKLVKLAKDLRLAMQFVDDVKV